MSLNIKVKRGSQSFNYFVITFGILSSLVFAIISVVDIYWQVKVLLITISIAFCFYLSFLNNWFRNKIVGIMSKIQEKVENHDVP